MGSFLLLMSACGPLGDTNDSGSETVAPDADTELTITVQPQGMGGPSRSWTLTCAPVGGTLPRAAEACRRLRPEALRPLPPDTICTQIYGGPQTARVRGQFRGRTVDARFRRNNGCEIHRWDSLRFLLPVRI